MVTLKNMDASVLAFLILVFIYYNVYSRLEKAFVQYKLYITLVRVNMLLIVIDVLGWAFNRLPGDLNLVLNTGSNLLLYIFEPLSAMFWVLYSDYQVFHDKNRLKKLKYVIAPLFILNVVLSAVSLYTGWFFSVDAQNIYHRGPYFWAHVLFCFSFLIYAEIFVIIKKRNIEKRHYYAMLLFPIPLLLGSFLQTAFYGLSYNWVGMMMSLLVIYFNIQDRSLNTDYLTGVYNRRQLDRYLKDRIKSSTQDKSFATILIDLDGFKQINDNFGHDAGDEALKAVPIILRKSLRSNDFIARYGGDEFFVILDIDNRESLKHAVGRINETVGKYNAEAQNLYEISFCMGYDIYDYSSKMRFDDFLKHIDSLMYDKKKSQLN